SMLSGLPMVNVNAMIFPLSSLIVISFYLLIKHLFSFRTSIVLMAVMLFAFSAGFGWFANFFLHEERFWDLSYKTQDLYFLSPFWNNLMFTHKGLAIASSLMSLALISQSRNQTFNHGG